MIRKTTTFRIEYYKETGKLYESGEIELEVGWIEDGSSTGIPYMTDARDAVEARRVSGPYPQLRGGWSGPIRLDHDLGFPVLMLPAAWRPFIHPPEKTSIGDVSTTPIGSIGP